MADDESPLIAGARKVYDTLNKWGANKDVGGKDTTDYSWHAQKVAEANKSHVDAEKKRGTTLNTTGSTTAKKPPAKKGKRKQGAGK